MSQQFGLMTGFVKFFFLAIYEACLSSPSRFCLSETMMVDGEEFKQLNSSVEL